MDDFAATLQDLSDQLGAAVQADPLESLRAIGASQAIVDEHRREAVRAAAQEHSWTKIGEALGVSKQAAHQKFAREWADELKRELKGDVVSLKVALKRGDYAAAEQAKRNRDKVIAEFRSARAANRKRA